jgi:enoyl-CoA hydratase
MHKQGKAMAQFVKVSDFETGIGCLEISRPDALNALNPEVLSELFKAVQEFSVREDLSVIILRTAGDKAFVAGADIKEMLNFKSSQAYEFSRFGQQVFHAMHNLPQVVIAQVQGFALGGGLELALAADFMISSQNAKFGLPEVGLGLIPGFGGTQRLVHRLGYARALEWMTSAERYDAQTAFNLGLLNRVVVREELAACVESVARAIASQGPQSVRAAKQCARVAAQSTGELGFEIEARAFAQRFESAESREGLTAFTEKRKPQFRK